MGWLSKLFNLEPDTPSRMPSAMGSLGSSQRSSEEGTEADEGNSPSGNSAYNRLKLVLMHDRTQLSPQTMEQMRDELVEVISKYVEIDQRALELSLESESNTIALVANIPIRNRAAAC